MTALNGVCRQVLSLKASNIARLGDDQTDTQESALQKKYTFLNQLDADDAELTTLMDNPLEYMRQLEMQMYRTDPHQRFWG